MLQIREANILHISYVIEIKLELRAKVETGVLLATFLDKAVAIVLQKEKKFYHRFWHVNYYVPIELTTVSILLWIETKLWTSTMNHPML